MNSKSPLILLVLITLLAGGSRAYTIEELNNHFKDFFEYAGAYLRQGGGYSGVYGSLYRVKNEFEQEYESGTLDVTGLNPTISRVAAHYIRTETVIFNNIFEVDISPDDAASWGAYLSTVAKIWKDYYERYYTGDRTLHGYQTSTIKAYANYWNMVLPLMRRFLDAQAPDLSLIDSIGNVEKPPAVPQPQRSGPIDPDAEYMDDMILDAVAIPRNLVNEARQHISASNSWASSFADWKAVTEELIDSEDEYVKTVEGWLDKL